MLDRFSQILLSILFALSVGMVSPVAADFTLDVDDDGQVDPLTDGLLIMRYLFGFSGEALTKDAVGIGAGRFGAAQLVDHLDQNKSYLDIDGDATELPLTDGLLIIRFLFGFEGEPLLEGSLDPAATRKLPAEIASYFTTIIDTDGDGIVDSLDDKPPLLTLLGESTVNLAVGDDYTDAGVSVVDFEDGDLSMSVIVFGLYDLNTGLAGDYPITYDVTDSGGNSVSVTRIVTVNAVNEGPESLTVFADGGVDDTWDLGIGAYDQGINYNSCENDGGEACPNIGWTIVTDEARGNVLQVTHSAAEKVTGLYIKTSSPADLSEYAGGTIEFDVKIVSGDTAMSMKVDCIYPCTSDNYGLGVADGGDWVGFSVAINDLVAQGLDLKTIDTGIVIWASQFSGTVFLLDRVRWVANSDGPTDGSGVLAPGTDWVNPNPQAGFEGNQSYPGYSLVWEDQFDGTELDSTAWNYETGGHGWGNNEWQYYRSRNAYLREGLLVIEAREENYGGRNYTSARLTTKDKIEFVYGRVDIRAALPTGQGVWPALWLLGANFTEVGWPSSGEIDLMEMLGQEDSRVYGTVHWSSNGSNAQYPLGGAGKKLEGDENYHNRYHVFSLLWSETQLEWLVDGESYLRFDITDASDLAAFRKEFFLIFNVAVGGNWPGYPNASTQFPQYMLVDYVRVFEQN
ncbi:MAG: family 16 glycosylhydrolase [Gammaproteobacteria bacterium]|jgi:hypothetical protein|nr:family 16 glycosylhydrolase [Gammaproteobacteria bacterium]MBT5203834.1 family 16 glycosylhydrolase [Gammaproteobacteria bacterium]MBT5603210.1 family 16 glycosylhydrolase [Gammaproteobacteria bacterium]MBT6245976.1 family 16 glycosylhydrolase [Gammaproteobacteria bacterium]